MYHYLLMDAFVTNPAYRDKNVIIKFRSSIQGLARFGETLIHIDKHNYFREYHIDTCERNNSSTLGFLLKNRYNDFILTISEQNRVMECENALYKEKNSKKKVSGTIGRYDLSCMKTDDICDTFAELQVYLQNEDITNYAGDIVFNMSLDSVRILGEMILNEVNRGNHKFAIPCIENKSHWDCDSTICTRKNKIIFV